MSRLVVTNKEITEELLTYLGFKRPEGWRPIRSDIPPVWLLNNVALLEKDDHYIAYIIKNGEACSRRDIKTELELYGWLQENGISFVNLVDNIVDKI